MNRDRVNSLLVVLTLLVLVAAAGMLFWVERQYTRQIDTLVQSTRDQFQRANVLRTPSDLTPNFAEIEDLARKAQTWQLIRRVFVTRIVAGRAEPVLMYPFWYAMEHPDWEEELALLHAEPVERNGQTVGVVYLDLDRRALVGVRASIGIVLGLIVVALLTLAARIFTQEKVLTATTQILEENQRELIRLERLSLAGLLTANIFHDIRKPMTNIKHEIGDLSEALGGFAGATRALRNIREQVNLFFDILNELNIERFVRADQADEEYVDINRVVEQSIRLVQYERGSTQLSVSLAPGVPLILAHPFRLVQVLSNIVLNAYQALQGRGELRVLTRTDGVRVTVEIADNGPGIPPADLERIFSPFFSGKSSDKGTGLGLYISRSIVEEMGGTIRGDSVVGHGATFTVSIPVSD
ncbi:hypothetical protein JW916_11210 [Candidatus Sumerlaeota bacterium]|nr:hypothetical protein [Candidatus Sumerlaeota bacterium]